MTRNLKIRRFSRPTPCFWRKNGIFTCEGLLFGFVEFISCHLAFDAGESFLKALAAIEQNLQVFRIFQVSEIDTNSSPKTIGAKCGWIS